MSAVEVDARAARAWPVLRDVRRVPAGSVIVGLVGEVLRVREDGGVDEILPGGHPRAGAASDPCNARSAA